MKVNELIEKLNQFNPDGHARVCTHPHEYDDDDLYDYIDWFSLEEDTDGTFIVVIHTDDNRANETVTTQKLIEKLNKFNPDGNAKVYTNYCDHERDCYNEIDYLSMDDADGFLCIYLHTYEVFYG